MKKSVRESLPRVLGLKPRPVLPSYQVLLALQGAPVLSSYKVRLSCRAFPCACLVEHSLAPFGGAGSRRFRRRGVSALKDGFVLNCQLSTVGQIGTMLVEGKEIGANTSVSALTLPMKRESPLLKDGELSKLLTTSKCPAIQLRIRGSKAQNPIE